MYSKTQKEKALELRKGGMSYNELQRTTGIPKSTLSSWFSRTLGMPFNRKGMLKHLAKIRILAAKAKTRIRQDKLDAIHKKVRGEVNGFPINSISLQKSMLAMLYWAEGAKGEQASGPKFANTDPKLIKLYVELLKKCYGIDPTLLSVRIHLHYYHKIKEVRKFWSSLLRISESQFTDLYVKKSV